MRKLVYYVASTLDGYIAGPDGGDPSGSEFMTITADLVQFVVANYPETLPGPAREALGIDGPGRTFDTVLEGRNSYEIGLAAGVDDAYPHLRHLVFSTTMTSAPAASIEVVSSDPLERVRTLKAEAGLDLWLVGGGKLAYALLPEIDRLILKLNPSVIGAGIPLFDGPFTMGAFRPTDHLRLDSGILVITYDRVG